MVLILWTKWLVAKVALACVRSSRFRMQGNANYIRHIRAGKRKETTFGFYQLHIFLLMSTILPGSLSDEQAFLDSVEGEISFFRSIMRARPVGKHRHFNALLVRNAILKDTGRSVHIESIWEKLRKCYNLDALEAIVCFFALTTIQHCPSHTDIGI